MTQGGSVRRKPDYSSGTGIDDSDVSDETAVLGLIWVAWWERVKASQAGKGDIAVALFIQLEDISCTLSTGGGSNTLSFSLRKFITLLHTHCHLASENL
jgi:hypothetical protein